MDILNEKLHENIVNKPEIEQVELEKHEYKLIGTFLRRKGLKLFSYNSQSNILKEIIVDKKETAQLEITNCGKLKPTDNAIEKATIDTRNIIFEALNYRSAEKRLKKYLSGEIKELSNLKPAGNKIDLW